MFELNASKARLVCPIDLKRTNAETGWLIVIDSSSVLIPML